MPRKPKPFLTLAEFSDAIKVPLQTFAGWVRRPDWTFERKAPWPAERKEQVVEWAGRNLERGRHGKDLDVDERTKLNDKKHRLEVATLRVKLDQAKAEHARTLGQLVPIVDVEAAWAQIAVTVRNAVENIPSQVVPIAITCGMPPDTAAKLQGELESLIAGVLRHLSANETKIKSGRVQGRGAGADGEPDASGEEIPRASGATRAVDAE